MIFDCLENAHKYTAMHPHFAKAFDFLNRHDLSELPKGRHEISGDQVFAVVAHADGISREDAKLEAHRKFIDIQFVLSGTDEMGWKDRSLCSAPKDDYDSQADVEFFSDSSDRWIAVKPGSFVIFFPEDAHAPLVSPGKLRKVIVKVATQ